MVRHKLLQQYHARVALALCIGLVLIVAHHADQPLLSYAFLPQIGLMILVTTVLWVLATNWKSLRTEGLGPKAIWVPLAVIAGSGVLRVLVSPDKTTFAGALFLVSMFGLYVIARRYGERALSWFMPLVIVGAITIVVQALIRQTTGNSGLFSEYATAAHFLVFGWIVSPQKHQWWLSAVVVTGLFFSGAPEAIFYCVVGGIVILARRDYSRKILAPIGAVLVLLLVCTPLGLTEAYWGRSVSMVTNAQAALADDTLSVEERDKALNEATNGRWLTGWRLHRPMQPLGYGIHLTHHYREIPHNIAVLVTDQLGPVAAVAWLAVIIGGIRKTKWKYGFLVLLLFGVFQPYVWTKMAPWLWAMAGASTTSQASGYVFR